MKGRDLARVAAEAKESAAGGDQWGPSDLQKLSPLGYDLLARMFNNIEDGANWP